MSNWYNHEREERTERYEGPRPSLPDMHPEFWEEMKRYLLDRCLSFAIAKRNGWYPTLLSGPRIVIPCSNPRGLIYYQARAMSDHKIRYLSPSASREDSIVDVWPAGKIIGIAVVEGPMDALAAAGEGYFGIGLMGNEPPVSTVRFVAQLCRRVSARVVVIVPDQDHPEMGAYMNACLAMEGVRSKVVLPTAKDLAECTPSIRNDLLHG